MGSLSNQTTVSKRKLIRLLGSNETNHPACFSKKTTEGLDLNAREVEELQERLLIEMFPLPPQQLGLLRHVETLAKQNIGN